MLAHRGDNVHRKFKPSNFLEGESKRSAEFLYIPLYILYNYFQTERLRLGYVLCHHSITHSFEMLLTNNCAGVTVDPSIIIASVPSILAFWDYLCNCA